MKALYRVEVCLPQGEDEDSCFVVAESIEKAATLVAENLVAKNSSAIICEVELVATEDGFRSLLIVDPDVSAPAPTN